MMPAPISATSVLITVCDTVAPLSQLWTVTRPDVDCQRSFLPMNESLSEPATPRCALGDSNGPVTAVRLKVDP